MPYQFISKGRNAMFWKGFFRKGGPSAPFSVSIGSGPFTTGTLLTATITPDPAPTVPTYQWTDDGVNITGATSQTYTPTIGTDSVAEGSIIRCVATVDGEAYTSNGREIQAEASTTTFDSNAITFDSNLQTFDEAA